MRTLIKEMRKGIIALLTYSRVNQSLASKLPEKDLAKTLPIPGYRGHSKHFKD